MPQKVFEILSVKRGIVIYSGSKMAGTAVKYVKLVICMIFFKSAKKKVKSYRIQKQNSGTGMILA